MTFFYNIYSLYDQKKEVRHLKRYRTCLKGDRKDELKDSFYSESKIERVECLHDFLLEFVVRILFFGEVEMTIANIPFCIKQSLFKHF